MFVLIKAAQWFAVPAERDRKAYACRPQPETRGERRAGQKGPFMDGHHLNDRARLDGHAQNSHFFQLESVYKA